LIVRGESGKGDDSGVDPIPLRETSFGNLVTLAKIAPLLLFVAIGLWES
jgi:hypothetical protein